MSDENRPPQVGQKRPSEDSAFTKPPRKKAQRADEWTSKGRHIGRSIHAFANFAQIMVAGIQLDKDLALSPDGDIEKYPFEDRLKYSIYSQVLKALPELEGGLARNTINTSSLNTICGSIQFGANMARSDDIKGLKCAVVDWIAHPVLGLKPPIPRNQMGPRGFNHDVTGRYLCPAGLEWDVVKKDLQAKRMTVPTDQWPIFIYANDAYDPESPWDGFLRGRLLVNAFKHVFTSPSSVDNSGRATKSSNSELHGMTKVTIASIVYIATLVRFCLGDQSTLARSNTVENYQAFYNGLLMFLSHPDERENVNELLSWWNKQVFPTSVDSIRAPTANSPLENMLKLRMRRNAMQALGNSGLVN
ncbi:hypothetical protein GSI_04595 [Ganoderma sinense ZZ0214-1]|uniref:Uncharacterized protein n=1 Tax=Ganoderma sinense ZZ0214-1 TaxID=1077348 RepID=A0A2G8SH91_9APHY|nr:hypothetical protein GSI_04595 [Ganoderma sinense ZZ0214-1]